MEIFAEASRTKLRFDGGPNARGPLSAEDLWDLPLQSTVGKTSLDQIGMALMKKIKGEGDVVSLVEPTKKQTKVDDLRLEIVKTVISVKMAENAAALDAKVKADTREKVRAALHKKKDASYENMSEEDLNKLLATI